MVLSGCVLTPQVEFDNFVTDLDVVNRFEEIAFNIEFGRWSNTFQKDITFLIQDLASFEGEDVKSVSINNKFIKSANSFLESSVYYYNDNNFKGGTTYQYAIAKYKEALVDYHEFVQ